MERKLFKKKDIIVFAVIALLVIVFILIIPKNSGGEVEIHVDGELVALYPLDRVFEIKLDNGVEIKGDGKYAYFCKSDCADKVCINTGKLSKSGEWAACLPNGTVIKIVKGNGGVDTMIG